MNKLSAMLASAATSAVLAMPAVAQDKSSELHQAMSKSMQEMQSMKMTGDIDRDFAMMMKHHHQSGIAMAQIQARNGKDPEMRQQAQEIVDSQQKEVAEFDRWLQSRGASNSPAQGASGGSGNPGSGHRGHGSR